MQPPALPNDEAERLESLRGYQLLDTLPEQAFDDLTALAAHICDAPISLISLVDERRQWFKSRHGLTVAETARDVSFCGHAILDTELFVVPDASEDDRFADNPLVTGDLHIRFYAGAPLVSPDGHALGALCVMDRVPHQLAESQRDALRVLSRQVMAQLAVRQQARALRDSEQRLRLVTDNARVGLVVLDRERRYTFANRAYAEILGLPAENLVGQHVCDVLPDVYASQIAPRLDRAFGGDRITYELRRAGTAGEAFYTVRYEPTAIDGVVRHVVVVITDVTEHKVATREARRLAAIVESSNDAIVGHDLDGIVTSWNAGAELLFGYPAAEAIATSVSRLMPPGLDDEALELVDAMRRGDVVKLDDTRRVTRGGTEVVVSLTASPVRNELGRVVGAAQVIRDVTEHQQAENRLREREEQLRLYAQNTPAAVAMFDRDMRYLVASRRWLEDYHLGDAPIVGRSHYELLPDLPERFRAGHQRCLAGSVERCDEDRFVRADGSVMWIHWEIRPWRRSDGTIGGIIIFTEDVTARREQESALRASEDRYRSLFDAAPDGILIADGDSNYIDANPSMCQMLGYERRELIGLHASDIVAPAEVVHVAPALETIHSGAEYHREWAFRRRDGSVFPAEVMATKMPDGNLVGMVRDVSDRRSLEAQYQQAQKMEAVGRLAGGVAHDFNNLLTSILGYCELLLEGSALSDTVRPDVLEIQKAGVSAASLTRQLLAFSRKQIIEPELLDLNVVVGGVQGMLARLIGEDVTIAMSLGPDPGWVLADRGQLEQVLMNLAVNARDAMPRGGTLTIETRRVDLDQHYAAAHFAVQPGPYVALLVTDTGDGMAAEVQAHLFEPFFTTKDAGKGTGLGLATVHGIVSRCGGSVTVYSELGQGTSFAVYFPHAQPCDGPIDDAGATTDPPAGSASILVVEDSAGVRDLVRRLLSRKGYVVLTAADADEATRIVDEQAIDVLLTDVVMPGGSGPELTSRLADTHPDLKVIYMSGYTEEAVVQHGVVRAGIAFLHKPFTSRALSQKIHEVLSR
jgi:PAS domain S-box-containing protein